MAPSNQYDHTNYSITPNADGSTVYAFATPYESLFFAGVDASKDADDRNVVVIQLRDPSNTERGTFDGPVIRSTGDEHYTRLKSAVLSRAGGQEDWDKLGVDSILSAGTSQNSANTLASGAPASDTATDIPLAEERVDPIGDRNATTDIGEDRADQIGDRIVAENEHGTEVAAVIVHADAVDRVRQIADKIEAGHHHTWTAEIWEGIVTEFRRLFPKHAS